MLCSRFPLAPTKQLLERRQRQLRRAWTSAVLTEREHQILGLVGDGKTSAAIAAFLDISSETVDTHVEAACSKLGASTRAQAAALISGASR